MNVTFAFWWWSELRLMLCFWDVNLNSWLEGSKQNYWSSNMFVRRNVNYGGWSIIFKNCITKCDETILVCVCPVDSVHYWVTCVLAGKSADQWVLCPLQWSPGVPALPPVARVRETHRLGHWTQVNEQLHHWIYRHLQKRQGSSITIKLPNPLLHMSPEFMLLK